ncbi:MAG: hypothetical protein P8P85_00680, partial [Acidimicrobiales bacterium]|nr:hypothetical protein [Acidimicrobiales bacterium]
YHESLEPISFTAPEYTRKGGRIWTDQEEDNYNDLIESFCGPGSEDAEVDIDEDGVTDYCDPELSEFEFDPGVGECPTLYEPIDSDDDGEFEGCTPPTTTTTTTTTTTVPTSSPATLTTTTTTTEPPDE